MFKIAICDDENFFTEELKELISGYMIEKDLIYDSNFPHHLVC